VKSRVHMRKRKNFVPGKTWQVLKLHFIIDMQEKSRRDLEEGYYQHSPSANKGKKKCVSGQFKSKSEENDRGSRDRRQKRFPKSTDAEHRRNQVYLSPTGQKKKGKNGERDDFLKVGRRASRIREEGKCSSSGVNT